jgi:predicted small metal-binding protein
MVKFARCNALLSLAVGTDGKGCRYVAKGESGDDVVTDMSEHLTAVHQVELGVMKENIMAATKTNRG